MHSFTAPSIRTHRFAALPCLALALGACFAPAASAQSWVPRYAVVSGASGSQLGSSMAIRVVQGDGQRRVTRMYVGAPFADKDGLADAGAVRIYNPSPQGWQLVSTLYSNMPQAGAHFGATLAFGFAFIVVGAPDFVSGGGSNIGAGRVEIYYDSVQPIPTPVLKLAISGGPGQHYGHSLAMDQDMLAIGYIPSNDSGWSRQSDTTRRPAISANACDTRFHLRRGGSNSVPRWPFAEPETRFSTRGWRARRKPEWQRARRCGACLYSQSGCRHWRPH